MILSICFYKQTLVKQCFTDLQGSSLHFIWFCHTFYLTNWMKLKMKFMRIKGDYTSYHDEMTKWCIAAVILCLDTSHRTSSVDKPQYTWAYLYLSLKCGFSGFWQWLIVKPTNHFVFRFLLVLFLICTLLQSWTSMQVIMALFPSLVRVNTWYRRVL